MSTHISKQMVSYLQDFLKYCVGGVVAGLMGLVCGVLGLGLSFKNLGFYEYALAIGGGMAAGVGFKIMMLCAIEIAMRANVASAQLNAKRAEMLGHRLKIESKDKIQAHVMHHAKAIILQMHGEHESVQIEHFFDHKMQALTEDAYFKIDRHVNYLTDRAVHGDVQSLKRLYRLYRRNPQERATEINQLLDRIINTPDEVHTLKDKIDTLYDRWKFRHEARSYVSDE